MSQAGLLSYSLQAVGGPANIKDLGMRYIRSCDPLSIILSSPITKKQTAMVGDLNIRVIIPNHSETDLDCPAV